jgi:hypothetical protein
MIKLPFAFSDTDFATLLTKNISSEAIPFF